MSADILTKNCARCSLRRQAAARGWKATERQHTRRTLPVRHDEASSVTPHPTFLVIVVELARAGPRQVPRGDLPHRQESQRKRNGLPVHPNEVAYEGRRNNLSKVFTEGVEYLSQE